MNRLPVFRYLPGAMLCGLLPFLVSGCRKTQPEVPEASVRVQAMHPFLGPISEEIAADAVLAPLSVAALTPRISAPIAAEYVQAGAHVHRGELLMRLDDGDLRANILDSRGAVLAARAALTTATQATIPEEVEKARADLMQLKAVYDVAHTTTEERRRLYRQGALPGRDLDVSVAAEAQAKAAYETARKHEQAVMDTTRTTDRQAAQGQLASAEGRLENAEAQRSYAELRSPIDGVVTARPLFPGETATTGTSAITVMDTSSLLAKLHLAQAATQQLALGHTAEVSVPGMQAPMEAKVSFIGPALDPGSTTVEVWLKLPNLEGRFKVGTPVHVVITGTTVSNALQVPASAIVPGEDGGTAVMIVGSDGAAHLKAVTVGIRTRKDAQILSGVSSSDMIITEGGYGLDDGTKVIVQRPDGAEDGSGSEGKDND